MSVHIDYKVNPAIYKRSFLPGINAIVRLVKSHAAQLNSEQKKIKVLDVGCGRGELMRALSIEGYECSGLDFDEECVRLSSKYGNVLCSDVTHIDSVFEKESFDIVVLSHILEHTSNQTQVIDKIKYVSRRYVLIAVPNACSTSHFYQGLTKRIPAYVNKGHRVGWAPGHFRTFLECICNLRILKWEVEKVTIPSRAATLFEPFGFRDFLELKLLPRYFPLLSNSLIVLCEKVD